MTQHDDRATQTIRRGRWSVTITHWEIGSADWKTWTAEARHIDAARSNARIYGGHDEAECRAAVERFLANPPTLDGYLSRIVEPGPSTAAERFKAARLASGLTQDEVAGQLGTNRHNISKIESGERVPTPQWLLWAAATLRWDAASLDPDLGPLVENLTRA